VKPPHAAHSQPLSSQQLLVLQPLDHNVQALPTGQHHLRSPLEGLLPLQWPLLPVPVAWIHVQVAPQHVQGCARRCQLRKPRKTEPPLTRLLVNAAGDTTQPQLKQL
jgi:hypothetical protein